MLWTNKQTDKQTYRTDKQIPTATDTVGMCNNNNNDDNRSYFALFVFFTSLRSRF